MNFVCSAAFLCIFFELCSMRACSGGVFVDFIQILSPILHTELFTTKWGFFELVSLTKHDYYSLTHTIISHFQYFPENCRLFNAECIHYLNIAFVSCKMFEVGAWVLAYIGLENPQNIWIYNVNGCDSLGVICPWVRFTAILWTKLYELLKTIGSSYSTALDNSTQSMHSMFFRLFKMRLHLHGKSQQRMCLHLEPIRFTIWKLPNLWPFINSNISTFMVKANVCDAGDKAAKAGLIR